MSSLLSVIAVFGVASFRLLPSLNRIVVSLQSFRYGIPVIHNLFTELNNIKEISQPQANFLYFNNQLKINNISYRYPDSKKHALKDISIDIPFGSSIGFIGESGVGKSTFIDVILGLLKPECGSVLVDGINIHSNLRGWQNNIGYVPQNIFLSDDSLRNNIAFGLSDNEIDDDIIYKVIEETQLSKFVKSLPEGLSTLVGERGIRLSGGQKQRIGIARALYVRPKVLVLDEATSSLDSITEERVMESVYAIKNITLIIIAHRLSTVSKCEKLYTVNNETIVETV